MLRFIYDQVDAQGSEFAYKKPTISESNASWILSQFGRTVQLYKDMSSQGKRKYVQDWSLPKTLQGLPEQRPSYIDYDIFEQVLKTLIDYLIMYEKFLDTIKEPNRKSSITADFIRSIMYMKIVVEDGEVVIHRLYNMDIEKKIFLAVDGKVKKINFFETEVVRSKKCQELVMKEKYGQF